MFNLHLLKNDLAQSQVAEIEKKRRYELHGIEYVRQLPMYTIAICPFCAKENIEHLHTYSPKDWIIRLQDGTSVGGYQSPVFHCEHFTLVWTFLEYADPRLNKMVFKDLPPYVYGLILEQYSTKSVIHALPVCEYVENQYVPRHTLFMITYFSESAKATYDAIGYHAVDRQDSPESNTWEIYPIKGNNEDHWYNLSYWVERGLLYWVDASNAKEAGDGKSVLRTHDVAEFPYKHLQKT